MKELTGILQTLREVIAARRNASPEASYVAKLFGKGRQKIAQKIGEEGVEVALAAVEDDPEAIASESADLLFHLLVLWEHADVTPEMVAKELKKREGTSGLAEKESRI